MFPRGINPRLFSPVRFYKISTKGAKLRPGGHAWTDELFNLARIHQIKNAVSLIGQKTNPPSPSMLKYYVLSRRWKVGLNIIWRFIIHL